MSNVNQNTEWKEELDNTALKYHVIALWVAVVFDMLFYVTDYFNIPEYRKEFFIFRLIVSLICLVATSKKRLPTPPKKGEKRLSCSQAGENDCF